MTQLDARPAAVAPGRLSTASDRRRSVVLGLMGAAGLIGVLASKVLTGGGYRTPLFGLPDPGPATAFGLPVAQYLAEFAGIGVVGVLFVRLLVALSSSNSAASDDVGAVLQRLSSLAVRWAVVWLAATAAWVSFTLSELVGVPVAQLPEHLDLVAIVLRTDRMLAEVATLWIALAIAMFGARSAGTVANGVTLAAAAAALLPSALLGHSAHHNATALAPYILGTHIVAAAVWVGGLTALVVHLRHHPVQLRASLPRFSAAALICVVVIGISGVLESVQMLDGWSALWSTHRGYLILAKGIALVVLAGYGYLHRRRTMDAAATGQLRPLLKLAASELCLMGATIGIAVALATTA